MFFNNFHWGVKKLLRCLYVGYQLCYAVLPGYLHRRYRWYVFQQFLLPGQEVIVVFVRPLLALQCKYYHVIYTQIIMTMFSTTFFPAKSYRGVCT